MFKKISLCGRISLSQVAIEAISRRSQAPFEYHNTPTQDSEEILRRIQHSDAVLWGWGGSLTGEIIQQCPDLKYIGMCGTSLDDIDVEAAHSRSITVTNIHDYGSQATVEFIFGKLLSLVRGWEKHNLQPQPTELYKKTLGIIGAGDIGQRVAKLALGFGMQVLYYSRSPKPEFERLGIEFTPLEDLLKSSDIISLHGPRGIRLLNEREFSLMKGGKILVNTSLGQVLEQAAFRNWIQQKGNYAIMDGSVCDAYQEEFRELDRVIISPETAGKTQEALERLGEKVVENIDAYLMGT